MLWPPPLNCTISLGSPGMSLLKLQPLAQQGQVSSAAVLIYSQMLAPGRTVMANPSPAPTSLLLTMLWKSWKLLRSPLRQAKQIWGSAGGVQGGV